MRLLEFQIERYGAIVERTITLNPAAGLAVVYGPNEIGKSTLLSGISDFFFGIPNNSPHGGVYGYDAMRLRARLVLADGTELNLRRRKGRGKTLADDVGQIYDQEVLARGLGPTTRDRFSNLFGLNHETLREGADRLLSADGEIGRLIIEAGGGLRDMVDRIAKLDPVIDGLFDLRRAGHRQFYKALDNIESADKTAKAELVSRDAYSEVRSKCEAAQRQYDALLENARDLAKRTSQIERLVRVQPLLSELEQLTRSLSSYAQVEALEPGFHRRIGAALDAVERCRREALRTKDAIERLNGRRDALTTDAEWPAYEERIATLSDRAVEVRKARQSLPNRRRELGESERSLQSLRALLNLAPEACLEAIAPTPAALDAAQRLVTQAVERRAALTAQSQTARELADDILALRESIERARAAGRDRPFGISDAELSALPEAEAGATAQGKRLAKEASDLDVCVRRIGFRDLDHIRATLLPDQDVVQAEVDLRAKLRAELEAVAGRKADAQSALRTAERQIAALEAGSILASPEALRQARDARQTALEPLVQSHLTGQLQGSQSQRADEVASLHGAVAQADDLSDRRAAESDRVAALEQHRARRDEAVCIVRDADAMIEEINGRLVATAQTFGDNYPAASAVEPDPAKLRAIVTEAVRLLDAAEHLQQRLADVEVRARELEPRLQSLSIVERRCALRAGNSPTLAQRVQEAVAAVRAHDTAYEDYVRDERSLVARDAQLLRAKETIAALQKEEDRWFVEWSAAATELSLEPTTSLDRAEQVLREWATARGELNNISQTRRRIEQMELDEKTLQEMVADLSRNLEISVPAETVEAASQVKKAWESHQKRWVESIGLEPEIRTAAEEQRVAVTALVTAEEALAGLSEQCFDFDGDFVGLSRRIEERDGIVDRIRQVQEQIRTAGDGFCVDELIRQCGDRDIDTLRAEHGGYDVERQKLDELTKAAIEEMQELDAALLAFDDPGKVNQAVADRECAATELHAIVERWTEMTLARDLLKEAISRVRAEHQDPLISRAGDFFKLTTRGAFVGVAADVDDDGEPVVVGCRDDDSRVAIREMSDGVRDQLFLAFRLASIERYAHAAEPIPFVVDDILVNFDDDRGPATLALLAEFGRTNQVLLFTHHKAVRDAAATLLGSAEVQVIDLPGRTASLDEAVRAA